MKISEFIEFNDNTRAEKWLNGASIEEIVKTDDVKKDTVINSITNFIKEIYDQFTVGGRHGNVNISIVELDKMLKSYSYYNDSILTVSNKGFFNENGERIQKLWDADLQETGKVFHGAKMIYTNLWKGERGTILNKFLSNLKPNEELISIHECVESVYQETDMKHVYAILKVRQLSIKQ